MVSSTLTPSSGISVCRNFYGRYNHSSCPNGGSSRVWGWGPHLESKQNHSLVIFGTLEMVSSSQATWENEQDLKNVPEVLKAYMHCCGDGLEVFKGERCHFGVRSHRVRSTWMDVIEDSSVAVRVGVISLILSTLSNLWDPIIFSALTHKSLLDVNCPLLAYVFRIDSL